MNEIVRSKGVAMGVCGPFVVVYHEITPTLEATALLTRASTKVAISGTRVGVVVVMDGAVRPPETQVRAAVLSFMERFSTRTSAVAYVLRGIGFSGAAMRAGLSGMLLVSKPKHPSRVFPDIQPAIAWLGSREQLSREIQAGYAEQIDKFCSSSLPGRTSQTA